MTCEITLFEHSYPIKVEQKSDTSFAIHIERTPGNWEHFEVDAHWEGDIASLLIDGQSYTIDLWRKQEQIFATFAGREYFASGLTQADRQKQNLLGAAHRKDAHVAAKMPGRVVEIMVKNGDAVTKGQGLLILEAMKMENKIISPRDGVIQEVCVKAGQNAETGMILVRFAEG